MPETPKQTDASFIREKKKEEAKRAAASISVLDYFNEFLDYRTEHLSNPMEWNRAKWLAHLQTKFGTSVLPDGAAIAGKHNYALNTKIPKLSEIDPGTWSWATSDVLAKLKLPPTGRSQKGVWEGPAGDKLAAKMKAALGL
jgi:hypothetical protein